MAVCNMTSTGAKLESNTCHNKVLVEKKNPKDLQYKWCVCVSLCVCVGGCVYQRNTGSQQS